MIGGEFPACRLPEHDEAARVARLLRHASHPVRLRLLHALVSCERTTAFLAHALDEPAESLSNHVRTLLRAGLVKRHSEGQQRVCTLTVQGLGLVEAYGVVAAECSPKVREDRAPTTAPPEKSTPPTPTRFDPLPNAALLFNYASHPLRLRILLTLGEEGKDSHAVASELGDVEPTRVGGLLTALLSGSLVSREHRGQHNFYRLTGAGTTLVQMLHSACGRSPARAGSLVLYAEPEPDGSATLSSGDLARLLRSFCGLLRIRVLHLLGSAKCVCRCHLFDALAVSRGSLAHSLEHLKANGLVLEEQNGAWVQYRLAKPAFTLYESLSGCFGEQLAEAEVFRSDSERLAALTPCAAPAMEKKHPTPKPERRKSHTA